jgi:hypothetical protein
MKMGTDPRAVFATDLQSQNPGVREKARDFLRPYQSLGEAKEHYQIPYKNSLVESALQQEGVSVDHMSLPCPQSAPASFCFSKPGCQAFNSFMKTI